MDRRLLALALAWVVAVAPAAAPRGAVDDDPVATLAPIFERVERFGDLTVEAGDGVVRLGGTTASPVVREEAEALAASLPGVLFVDNRIEIVDVDEDEPDDEAAEAAPTSLDERVQSRLRAIVAQVDELTGVEVAVEAGVVHLSGEVASSDAAERAAELARGIEGVVYVDDDLRETADLSRRLLPDLESLLELARSTLVKLPLILVALAVLLAFAWLARRSRRWRFPQSWLGDRVLLREQVHQVLWLAILLLGVFAALEVLDATAVVGAVLGAAGLAGLAVSFAFRDIIENHLASLLLSVRRPFAVKDVVEIDGTLAKVIRMTTSETLMLTLDGNHVRIPNAHVFKSKIVNYTRNPLRRFEFTVGVGTDVDLDAARELGLRTIADVPGVLRDPEPLALVDELGDSNVAIKFLAWVDQREADFSKVRSRTVQVVKTVFDAEEVDMPVPIQEIVVKRKGAAATRDDSRERQAAARREADRTLRAMTDEDVATDSELDAQIDLENATSDDVDLLTEPEA